MPYLIFVHVAMALIAGDTHLTQTSWCWLATVSLEAVLT